MTSSNPAALQGWVKSTDPKSGRVFYANHITRKTQWDPPADWVEDQAPPPPPREPPSDDDDSSLPGNWEVMHDPTTGKAFYVDHERKITTWTRPRKETQQQSSFAASLRPAVATPPTSGNYAAASSSRGRHAPAQQSDYSYGISAAGNYGSGSTYNHQAAQPSRSYQEEMAYYSQPVHSDVDFSDALPFVDFSVHKVADPLRPSCPHCHKDFTMRLRRHHCRLCGDVFCDTCSAHRVELPLEGAEFTKGPVRICDFCFDDVDAGNFFSLRRYLTPLTLWKGRDTEEDSDGVATANNVNAALSGLTQDLESRLQGSNGLEHPVSIPPKILMPVLIKPLENYETSDRAVRCLAALLAWEQLTGGADYVMYLYDTNAVDHLLGVLERSGSDRKTLYVQEQAARIIFYMTENKTVTSVMSKEPDRLEALDLGRAIRNVLDHATNERNPNLQRWGAACLKNLVIEDQRRACLAVNDVASAVAVGEESLPPLSYESVLEANVVQTGGVLLLGSLIASHDSDTRAHAVGALGAILAATRAIDASLQTLSEMTAGQAGRIQHKDGEMVRAIVSGGGCAASVAQLVLSADHSVARMGCHFLSSLVVPLLRDPMAGAALPLHYDYRTDHETAGACREAAIEIATGPCLPALMSLVRPSSRPMELRQIAAETLAATVFAIGEMGRAWSNGHYEEGLERSDAPTKFKEALVTLNDEGVIDCALAVLQSGGGQSLGASAKDTPASRIAEAAGTMLSSMTSCSAETIMEIQNRQVLSLLLVGSIDSTAPSSMRGDGAPRCFGTLDAAAAVLMFAWQHPSGASSELLDRLIEVIDAGMIPYLSRVLNIKVDWNSKDSPVGVMKAKAAASRLLCCVFGIALTDETGIGMRRLMDAVDSDAQSYRRSERSPKNIMEATASILQAASTRARSSLVGEISYGAHYQAALIDLVDATLLATGSFCGSSIAPGGSEGTMVTGESFLQERNDSYGSRRIEICSLTCDIIVRGGRGSPALLPTMLVGGLGESGVLSSLRLALAIAQNGTKDQHAKLAQSGILVPISDSLRTALSNGDLYLFSAALALVRFCGPYVAAGPGGGIQSVRDAIRVATNVLTLPMSPDASIEQIEKQENLKSECIAALEALSRNASLWSSISSDALPSIVRFLQMTASVGSSDPRRQQTRCAALRAVLQIVQVPSHAVSAARDGVAEALGALLQSGKFGSDTDEVPMLALEVLHVIASKPQSRKEARFIETGMVQSICSALGKSATDTPKKPSDTRADVTFLGLEILNHVLSDIQEGVSVDQIIQSPSAMAFLDMVSSEPQLIRSLCSTLLLKTNMKLPRHDAETTGAPPYDIPKLYGPPLILVNENCAGHDDTHHAAAALLLTSSILACAIESKRSDIFWKTMLLEDLSDNHDEDERLQAAATLSAHFLALLTVDYKPFVPTDPFRKQEYMTITRPLVRYRLLEAMKDSLDALAGDSMDPYTVSVLVNFNIPHVCLSLWKDPALLDLAFELIKKIVDAEPDEVLHLFVEGEAAIASLFDLLNLDSSIETSKNVNEIRRFLASILGQLAEGGLLTRAVEKFDVRSSAITALAAACLSEEERSTDDDEEDATSNRLSSVLMKCLVELCTVDDGLRGKQIRLSSGEAEAIATNLGKKICHMVLSRFLERAKLQQYEIEDEEDIMEAPDLAMLCALAQHDAALSKLRAVGGLHALSLVAGEGELMAMTALKKACSTDPSILLEDDSYRAIMKFIADDSPDDLSTHEQTKRKQVESAAFELLARLCSASTKGRNAIAGSEHIADCIARAMEVLSSQISLSDDEADSGEEEKDDFDGGSNDGMAPPPLPPPPSYDQMIIKDDVFGDNELAVSACLLLSALAPTSVARQILVQDDRFVRSLSSLAGDTSVAELRYAGLKLVSALLPYVAGEDKASTDRLCEVLLAALTSEHKLKQTVELNANLLHSTAIAGIIVVFDYLSLDQQETAAKAVAAHFMKTVKTFTVTRSTSKQGLRAHGAHLCYNLTLSLLLVRGKDFMDDVFTQELLKSFMNIIQWRHDPKTSLDKTDEHAWNASISNCLLILSLVLWRPDDILSKANLNLAELASTSLMLARPGKAPRKAIDLKSALTKITQSTDSAASLAASRILDRLF